MIGAPTVPWGKLQKDDDGTVVEWHPLVAHCADVAACAEALLRNTILGSRIATLAGVEGLSETDIHRLCWLSVVHDFGKFNHGFQRKALAKPKQVAGHVGEAVSLLLLMGKGDHSGRLIEALRLREVCSWCEGQDDGENAINLLIASVSHHGRPVNQHTSPVIDYSLWDLTSSSDPLKGVASLVNSACNWFPLAFNGDRTLPGSPNVQHAFAGLVMLADWLGSDRSIFCYASTLEDRMPFARQQAELALREIGLDTRATRLSLGLRAPGFASVSAHDPRPAQCATLALPVHKGGSLTILESETGSGKTEAALGRFVQMFHAGEVDGMTFALPTRTAATQIHARVVEAVARAFPDPEARLPVVLAVPGPLCQGSCRLSSSESLGARRPCGHEVQRKVQREDGG
jgi:CRISPR-associated endonuclease/helicase Cas3